MAVLLCGACGWFGPSNQGVVAVVANPEGRGWLRLRDYVVAL